MAVGGRGTLYGAVAGAVLVNYAKTYFTAALPEFWLYALGALFVLVTLFLPRGVVGLLDRFGSEAAASAAAKCGDRMNAAQVVRQGWQKVFGAGTRQRPARCPGDASHGTILYLEDITVSFDGFTRAERPHAVHRRGRAALHHRSERRRQDHDDGCDHRQDAPGRGLRLVRHTTDLLTLTEPEIAEAGIGRKFQKPTVFEQHSVLQNLELAAAGNKSVWHTLFKPLASVAARAHR